MEAPRSPEPAAFLPLAFLMMVIGWGGLGLVVFFQLPTLGPRWLFFFLSVLALTGTALPIVALLHRRFPRKPPARQQVIVRQALWVGVYIPTLVWLQLGRVLNFPLALLLAIGFLLIEWLLRYRERSQWEP
ncbi:MAG: hypothetical protein AB1345_10205 [Chloroflexota bacterium]